MPAGSERSVCIYTPSFPDSDKSASYQAQTFEDVLAGLFQSIGVNEYICTDNANAVPRLITDRAILAINGNSQEHDAHHLVRNLRTRIPQTTAIIVFLDPPHHYLEGGCHEAGADIVFRCLPPQEIEHYQRSMRDIVEIARRNRFTVLTASQPPTSEEKAA